MDRYKQFECLEGTFTWYDEIMSKYEAALWVHYRMLCKMIDIWIDEVKRNEEPPRVMYFIHTEYMSMVLSELLLTVEILLKAEVVRAGCPEHELRNHTLLYLLDKLTSFDSDRCVSISKLFDSCRCFFDMMDKNNTFVNVRYIDYDKVILDSDVVFDIRRYSFGFGRHL